MPNLADLNVVENYRAAHRNDSSDKLYPNLMLVRSLAYLFKGQKLRILDYGCGYGANSLALSHYSSELVYADTCDVALSKTCQKLSPLTKQSNLWALSSIRAVTVCLFMMGRLTSSFVPQCCRCFRKLK